MNNMLLSVVRQDQDGIRGEFLARLPADSPHSAPPLVDDGCVRLLVALLALWQNNEDSPLRRCSQSLASLTSQNGWEAGAILQDLDALASAVRSRLADMCDDPSAILSAADDLDEGIGRLRREYLAACEPRADRAAQSPSVLAAWMAQQPEPCLLATLEGKPFHVNEAACELLGLPNDQDPAAIKLRELLSPETWSELRGKGFADLRQSGVWQEPGQLRHAKTGEMIDVEMHWQLPRASASSKPACLAVRFADRRAGKARDQLLRESEARKAAMLESSLDPIITMDHDGRIIEFNRAAEKVFGRPRASVMGQELARILFPASETEAYQDRLDRYLGAGAGSLVGNRTEIVAARANGEEFPMEMAMTMGHVEGRPVCTFFMRDISESRKVQRALRDSEALYHSLVEHLPVSIYRKDSRGTFTFGNASYCAGLGRKPAAILGKTDFDLFPKELAHKYRDDDRNVLDTGEVFEAVEEHFRPDGEKRFVHVLKAPVRDSHGKIVGTQGLFWDITSRIRAEQALRESEQRLQSVLDNTTAVVYLKNREGQYLGANRSFQQLFKLESHQILGKTDFEVFPQELAQAFRDNDLKVMAAEGPLQFEEQAPDADDGLHTYVSIKVPLRDDAGEVYGICGISTDITSRKRAEEETQRLTKFLDSIVKNLPIMLFVKDAQELRFERFNKAGEEVLGVTQDQVLGKNDFDLFPQELAERYVAKDREVLERCSLIDVREESIVTPRGERVLHTRKIPILDDAGRPTHLLGISEDITEAKRREVELRAAKEAAEAASRAKSAFLANMSHEIRTPLTGVIGMSDLLLDTPLTQQQREYSEMIRNSGHQLLGVIGDVLDFSKIEAGKMDLDCRPFRARDGLGDTMRALSLRAKSKSLELVCHVRSDVPEWIIGDDARLRQIVINLVGNALKFTQQGEIVLTVEVESLDANRVMLHFIVADTGIGIPQEKQLLIFQAFEQADTSTTRRYGGTGLGLTISSRLVEMMGGRLWVESEVGQGSQFHFTAEFDLPAQAIADKSPAEPAHLHGLSVLVVDDNATNRMLLTELLSKWQMRSVAVEGGQPALEELRRAAAAGRPFSLVLLDAQMPDQDGFCLAEKIQAEPDLVQGSIMMLTSSDQSGDIARCRELGIAAYLTKPIKQSELFDAILNVIGAANAAPTIAAEADATQPDTGPTLRILLVEDSPVNQVLALAVLDKRGHQAVLAENGRQALEAVDREPFDLILMDVQMPEMDGFEATAAIRRREKDKPFRTPIVAMTAHAIKGDRERCLAAGMDSYLAKPVHPTELFATMRQMVRRPTVLERAADGNTQPPATTDNAPSAANDSSDTPGNSPTNTAETVRPSQGDSPSDNGGLVHCKELLSRLSGDRAAVQMLARTFTAEINTLLPAMRRALAEQDIPVFRRSAHTLKGSANIFAIQELAAVAQKLETIAKGGSLDGAEEPFAQLQDIIGRMLPELEQLGA
ncbi:MAG: PAS domain-containing protein [Pirellulales bacterium]